MNEPGRRGQSVRPIAVGLRVPHAICMHGWNYRRTCAREVLGNQAIAEEAAGDGQIATAEARAGAAAGQRRRPVRASWDARTATPSKHTSRREPAPSVQSNPCKVSVVSERHLTGSGAMHASAAGPDGHGRSRASGRGWSIVAHRCKVWSTDRWCLRSNWRGRCTWSRRG